MISVSRETRARTIAKQMAKRFSADFEVWQSIHLDHEFRVVTPDVAKGLEGGPEAWRLCGIARAPSRLGRKVRSILIDVSALGVLMWFFFWAWLA